MSRRLDRLRRRMQEREVEALWVSSLCNRAYLSGFDGTAGALLITATRSALITDFRYVEAAREQAPEFEVHRHTSEPGERMPDVALRILHEERISQITIEAAHVSWAEYQSLQETWQGVTIEGETDLVEELRLSKEPQEIERIRQACALSEAAFAEILPLFRPGVSEREIALELEFAMRRRGARAAAFEFIIASGSRGALPHGYASEKLIEMGDLVTVDFGAEVDGYTSDITRTVAVGRVDDEQRYIYTIVRQAQAAGLAAVRPGVRGGEVDRVARQVIEQAGFGTAFGHSLGHGVGREVHEAPRLAQGSEDMLAAGMIVTVEPGIYRPGWGGVRIEDTVVVTETGYENLCHSGKELLVI